MKKVGSIRFKKIEGCDCTGCIFAATIYVGSNKENICGSPEGLHCSEYLSNGIFVSKR